MAGYDGVRDFGVCPRSAFGNPRAANREMKLSRTHTALGTLALGLVLSGCGNAGTERERATAGTGDGSREAAANRSQDLKSPYEEPRTNRAGQAMLGDAKHPQAGVAQPGQGAATTGPEGRGGTGQPQPAGQPRQ